MKKLLVTFLLTILSFVTYSQSGVGYVNYTSYKTHNGTGTTNQYPQFAGNATQFDFLLNTTNSNTTITHTGEVTLATMCNGSTGTPHWGGDFMQLNLSFGLFQLKPEVIDLALIQMMLVTYRWTEQ